METFNMIFTPALIIIIFGAIIVLSSKVSKLERRQRNMENPSDIVQIKNMLQEHIGKEAKLDYYDNSMVYGSLAGNHIFSFSKVVCEIVELDDKFIEVIARVKIGRKVFKEDLIIPLDNIKSIKIDNK